MKKELLFFGLALLLAFGVAPGKSYGQSESNVLEGEYYYYEESTIVPDTSAMESTVAEAITPAQGNFALLDGMDLIGSPVKDSTDELLGLISRLQIDARGHAFAVINHGSYEDCGEGGCFTPVPFEALQISKPAPGEITVALNMDERQLEAAPFYDPLVTDSRQYEASIYLFYGIQPYWTEGNLGNQENFPEEGMP